MLCTALWPLIRKVIKSRPYGPEKMQLCEDGQQQREEDLWPTSSSSSSCDLNGTINDKDSRTWCWQCAKATTFGQIVAKTKWRVENKTIVIVSSLPCFRLIRGGCCWMGDNIFPSYLIAGCVSYLEEDGQEEEVSFLCEFANQSESRCWIKIDVSLSHAPLLNCTLPKQSIDKNDVCSECSSECLALHQVGQ